MKQTLILGLLALFVLAPVSAEARYGGEIAGWIPWWTGEAGPEDALENLHEFDVIYPFVYEVEFTGELVAKADLEEATWEDLIDEARDEEVLVIPSILWTDGAAMQFVLGDRSRRDDHIEQIVDMVKDGDFDGVDIDYEGKLPQTKDHFSRFLEDLHDELEDEDAVLTCTIEARTPPEDLYREVPDTLRYANDYEAMNEHCDWVEIMAYDQQRAVLTLNDKRKGVPYAPVADNEWVESVLKLALEDIDEDKIILGVATYGRAWDVTVAPEWYKEYQSVAALNHPRIMELSEEIYDAPIGRDQGGDAVISYFPKDSIFKILNALPVPKNTPLGYEAAAKALLFSNLTEMEVPVRFVSWSDARAIEDKLDLAEEYDLKGVSFFKIDGEEDEDLWRLF